MLAFCTNLAEIALVLEQSDARWLSEEMSFLSELYRSKADNSERQFGEDDNPASASFWETALKCQRLSVALQTAVGRGYRQEDDGVDQRVDVSTASPPRPALASPGPANSSQVAESKAPPKRTRRAVKARAAKKRKARMPAPKAEFA
jgi:hypothetical protein